MCNQQFNQFMAFSTEFHWKLMMVWNLRFNHWYKRLFIVFWGSHWTKLNFIIAHYIDGVFDVEDGVWVNNHLTEIKIPATYFHFMEFRLIESNNNQLINTNFESYFITHKSRVCMQFFARSSNILAFTQNAINSKLISLCLMNKWNRYQLFIVKFGLQFNHKLFQINWIEITNSEHSKICNWNSSLKNIEFIID